MKKRLLVSFSGGRTSAYMTWWLLNLWDKRHEYDIVVVFANTGKEKEATLEFVRDCDKYFGFNTVWVESVFHGYGTGASFKVVNFETASRKGEPFEAMIAKLGIPNSEFKHCTRELKTVPITKYVRSLGWTNKTYYTAIGYRVDEPKRWKGKKAKSAIEKMHLYPFVYYHPVKKPQVLGWWKFQPFDLQLEDHEGNCDLCYKKSEPKLIAIIAKEPRVGDWWENMGTKYENFIPAQRDTKFPPPFRFFRGQQTVADLRAKVELYFEGVDMSDETTVKVYLDALLNGSSPKQFSLCNESCEAF